MLCRYEGLGFVSSSELPHSVNDQAFPPIPGLPVRIADVPVFTVAFGLGKREYQVSTGLTVSEALPTAVAAD